MHSQSDSDFSQFLSADRLPPWSHSDLHDQLISDNQAHTFENPLQTKNFALTWSENLHSSHNHESSPQSTLQAHNPLPTPFIDNSAPNPWASQWQHLLNSYPLQRQLYSNSQSHLSLSSLPHLPLLTVPGYSHPDGPPSASYSSASPISYATADSSPFSFPPSPLPVDPCGNNQFPESDEQIYVHPADLSAPVLNPSAAIIPEWNEADSRGLPAQFSQFSVVKDNTNDPSSRRFTTSISAPLTRSDRSPPPSLPSESTSDIRNSNHAATSSPRSRRRAVRHRGEKRKRTPPKTSRTAPTTKTRSNRIGQTRIPRQGQTTKGSKSRIKERDHSKTGQSSKEPRRDSRIGNKGYDNKSRDNQEECDGDDHDAEDSDDYEDEDNDSYSTSASSYSPSASPPPRYSAGTSTDLIPSANGAYSKSRVRRRANGQIPLPVPVPNLTKKSRGRKVPSMPNGSGGMSATDTNGDSNGSNIDIANLCQRGYMCRVPGCGKCFVRGEHLKRHVRSIHTYEKPHSCPHQGCDKTFSRRDNLSQHLRVHR